MNATEQLLEQVESLTWALVDENISDNEISQLEKLLLDHAEARKTYIECMQMHADLHFMFKQSDSGSVRRESSRLPAAIVNAVPMANAHMPIAGK